MSYSVTCKCGKVIDTGNTMYSSILCDACKKKELEKLSEAKMLHKTFDFVKD